MMSQSDLGAAFLDRDVVKNAAPQTRTDRAECLAFRHQPLHDRVSVLLDDAKRHAAFAQIIWQNFSGKIRLFLIEIDGQQIEFHRRALLHIEQ